MKRCSDMITHQRNATQSHNEIPFHAHYDGDMIYMTIKSVDEDLNKLKHCWGECIVVQSLWKHIWQLIKNLNIVTM